MGFFKKIGGFVKKATKQISFKNLVKVGTPLLGGIPLVGGLASNLVGTMQANHEAKKEQQAYDNQVAEQQMQQAAQAQAIARRNPNIGDILIGAGGGALTGAGQVLAGSTSAGQAGATLVDSTMTAWFKKNWLKLVGGILATVLVIFLFVKMLRGNKRTSKRRY